MAQRRLILRSSFFIFIVAGAATAFSGQTAVLSTLAVNEPVEGDVVAFGADIELGPDARVSGDAVAVGGDVRLVEGARVGRHVVAVFGSTDVPSNTQVGGRILAFASLAGLQTGAGGENPLKVDFAMRLLASGGWLLVTTGFAFLFPARFRCAAWAVPVLGLKVPLIGLLAGLTIVASLVAALGLGPALGVPLVAALMIVFFVAKAAGLTVLACWSGAGVLRRWLHHPTPISLDAFVGVLMLLAVRFLPFVGETLWTVISIVGLGASLAVISVSPDLMRAGPTRS